MGKTWPLTDPWDGWDCTIALRGEVVSDGIAQKGNRAGVVERVRCVELASYKSQYSGVGLRKVNPVRFWPFKELTDLPRGNYIENV